MSEFEEGAEHEDLGGASEGAGQAGAPDPPPPPETDPTVRDAGPPADGPADPEGTSGAEEGLNPLDNESYRPDAEGPRSSTED